MFYTRMVQTLGERWNEIVWNVYISLNSKITLIFGRFNSFLKNFEHIPISWNVRPFSNLGRSCPVGRVLSSWPENPISRLAWRKLPCTLMAPGACKLRRGYNVLLVPFQIIPLGEPKRGEPFPPGQINIAIACLRIILRNESRIVGNSPLA